MRPSFLSLFASRVTAPRLRPSASASAEILSFFFRAVSKRRILCAVKHSVIMTGSAKVIIFSDSRRSPFARRRLRSRERRTWPSNPSVNTFTFMASPDCLYLAIEPLRGLSETYEFNFCHSIHVVALMHSMGIIEPEHSTVVLIKQVGQ